MVRYYTGYASKEDGGHKFEALKQREEELKKKIKSQSLKSCPGFAALARYPFSHKAAHRSSPFSKETSAIHILHHLLQTIAQHTRNKWNELEVHMIWTSIDILIMTVLTFT